MRIKKLHITPKIMRTWKSNARNVLIWLQKLQQFLCKNFPKKLQKYAVYAKKTPLTLLVPSKSIVPMTNTELIGRIWEKAHENQAKKRYFQNSKSSTLQNKERIK